MATVRSYWNAGEAGFAQSLLESAGILATLEHESSTLLAPPGVSAVRLLVPDDQLEESRRILEEHPIEFSAVPDDAPRFGFWRGSAYGLVAGTAVAFGLSTSGASSSQVLVILWLAWSFGAIFGVAYKVKPSPGKDLTRRSS